MNHNPTPCFHGCNEPAVAVFYFPHGCYCSHATVQSLCLHHAHRSRSEVGDMELIKDLSVNGAFGKKWNVRGDEL